MREEELIYRIALTQIDEIGPVKANRLLNYFGTASQIFSAKKEDLIEVLGEKIAANILQKPPIAQAEKELQYLKKNQFCCITSAMPNYPQRLINCPDAPSVLYSNAAIDLNANMVVSIVGTRNNSSYGKQMTEEFIAQLPKQGMLIISGLAFGIDAIAHKTAIQHQIPTVGVVAHGLDRIYPNAHRNLVKEMLQHQGAMLTEFMTKTYPEKHHFPSRNRIVAGMADATIVIETDHKGGSMITAHLAFHYDRALFAVPGRITDPKSNGCNKLILQNKASIYTGMKEFLEWMNWPPTQTPTLSQSSTPITPQLHLENPKPQTNQSNLTNPTPITASQPHPPIFEFSPAEKTIIKMLQAGSSSHPINIDEFYINSGLNSSAVATALLQLELKKCVEILPGRRYKLKD